MDILDHLRQEHRNVESLMASLAETEPGADRNGQLAELEEALARHMAVEEQFLYPIVADTVGAEDAEEANVEHELGRRGLATLREMADKPGFGAALNMLKGGIGHHVSEEEDEIFPKLRSAAGDRLGSMDPDALEAVAGATREQLLERARAAGIKGRSKMSKAELAKAVISEGEGT